MDLQTIWDNFLYIPGWCFSTNYLYTESGNLFLTKLKTQILQLSFFLPLTSIPLDLGWLSQCIWLPDWMELNRLWTSTRVFPFHCCKYSPCKKTERCNFPILTQIHSRCGYFHISINTISCLLAEGACCHMWYRVHRCYGQCHSKEVRGDCSDLSHPHFIIKMLMDHSRKSLQSLQMLLLDVALDILGTSTIHLCLVSASGELEVGYVWCLVSPARVCRLQFPLSLKVRLKNTLLLPWAGSAGCWTSLSTSRRSWWWRPCWQRGLQLFLLSLCIKEVNDY